MLPKYVCFCSQFSVVPVAVGVKRPDYAWDIGKVIVVQVVVSLLHECFITGRRFRLATKQDQLLTESRVDWAWNLVSTFQCAARQSALVIVACLSGRGILTRRLN